MRRGGYAYGGPAFIGGILVGLGLSILLGDFGAWLLIGIGAGFILMAFIAAVATPPPVATADRLLRWFGRVEHHRSLGYHLRGRE